MGMELYLILVLIFMSIMTKGVDHLVIGLLAITMSSLKTYLYKSFALLFLLLSCKMSSPPYVIKTSLRICSVPGNDLLHLYIMK